MNRMSTDSPTPAPPHTGTRAPTPIERLFDRGFRGLTWVLAWGGVVLLLLIVLEISKVAAPAVKEHGVSLMGSSDWNPSKKEIVRDPETGEIDEKADPRFGLAAPIFGTIYSSLIALVIATVLGVAVAIFITEDFLSQRTRTVMKNVVELLAAIPSVIYGLWGIFVLSPLLQKLLAFNPTWSNQFNGSTGILPAALVLAIMILPTITALSRNALASVPPKLREGAVGLGATRWETIFKITLPTSTSGIVGAVMLGFGRALGETMALAMLIGGKNVITWSLLSPGNTLAALLANNFPEALTDKQQIAALMYAALVLMVITLAINMLGSLVIWRSSIKLKGLR
jgi:phosphate transport system permease protein